MKIINLILLFLFHLSFINAQTNYLNENKLEYILLRPGLEYKIFQYGNGDFIKENQYVMMQIVQKIGDSTIMSTYSNNNNEPILNKIAKAPNGESMDPFDVFLQLRTGDSVVIRFNQDSVLGKEKPSFVKPTDEVILGIKITEILNQQKTDSIDKLQLQQLQEQQNALEEQQIEDAKNIAKRKPIDDKILSNYIKKYYPNAIKTKSGLYYILTKTTNGEKCEKNKDIIVNYTGTFLNGKKFDSNIDSKFNHHEPFKFTLGVGQVIPGWDEGIALLKKGEKATLIIPSYLAYGPAGQGYIPANTCLKFEVEVLNIK